MSKKISDADEQAIQQRVKDFLPDILDRLQAHKHPKKGEVERLFLVVAARYERISRLSDDRRKAIKKIAKDARQLQHSLSLKTLPEEREELHAILDARLHPHPRGTLGHIFPRHSIERLLVQLDELVRAFDKDVKLTRRDPKGQLCRDCLIIFEIFRRGRATAGKTDDLS